MMSKFQGEAGTQNARIIDLAAVFTSCLALSFFHSNLWGSLSVQLSFIFMGWGVGWYLGRTGVLLLLIFTTAWGIYILLTWWGTPGVEFWILLSHAVIPIIAMGQVGSSLRRMSEHLDFIAGQDPLTGLLNQKRFMELLDGKLPADCGILDRVAVVFLDCDQFKSFNDTHGHLEGDQYLIDVANQISKSLDTHDLAARFGGDEFVILFETSDEKSVLPKVTALREMIACTIPQNSQQSISWSVGVAIDSIEVGANKLVNTADQAMYTAKRNGPGQTHIVTASVSGEE